MNALRKSWTPSPSLPWLIGAITAAHVAIALVIAVVAGVTGKSDLFADFLRFPGALFLVSASATGFWLSWRCWRQFSKSDLLRQAWLLIMWAAGLQCVGTICTQVLGAYTHLNPLMYTRSGWPAPAIGMCARVGLLLNGPFQMTLLACGLSFVLRAYRRSGLFPHMARWVWLLAGTLVLYTMHEGKMVQVLLQTGKVRGGYQVLGWPSDPLLIVLLFEALCILRPVLGTGWGLIARCWGAFAAGIALHVLGDILLWAAWDGSPPDLARALGWLAWFLAAAAYALGPAYQLEAFRQVLQGGRDATTRRAA
jgi:hypothetical protein